MRLYMTSYDPWNSSYRSEDGKIRYRVSCHQRTLGGKTAVIYRAFHGTDEPTPEDVLLNERHFSPSSPGPSHILPEVLATCQHGITEEPRGRVSFESHEHDFQAWGDHPPSVVELERVATHDAEDDHFLKIGEVEFHTISSTVIRHFQHRWKTSEFFKKQGSDHYGSDRVFTGFDGKKYMWRMKSTLSELYLLEPEPASEAESEQRQHPVLIARLHNPNVGVSFEKRHPPSLDIFKGGEDMMDLILITFVYIEKVRREREALGYSYGPRNMQSASQVLS
ncbi:hypothetical protein CVT24_012060 [Panaeolus cyanescens]|uniref:DUF6593 domain-containing protein n=1 Tax=Panaeolus cyanescens TaxID=181874 RepID=A0A409VHV0_9AGAR|nr:hypothetical protein CVT24_012060 [Panaeolus cyanescens]